MSHKVSSRQYAGPGYVQRLAKKLQVRLRISYTEAVARAKAMLGVS